jgi:hypothetical protein
MNLQQAYYEQKFENAFLKCKGDAFQTFFETLMGFAHKADFMACRPWGNRGDRKNDGFLKSERRLFQVYAPNDMTETMAISKIQADFEGAKKHWKTHFDKWVFAHNAIDGLPPHVQKVLLDFEKENQGVTLEPWCLEEFRLVFRRLSNDDLFVWFGAAPTAETKIKLGFKDLEVVLEHLASQSVGTGLQVKDVPRRKIEANALSESVATLIREGMTKTPLVSSFFEQWHDSKLGERIADAFRKKYEALRDSGLTPNLIFAELQSWAGGAERGTPEHELSVLTVLAYYFECCDIFEEPREIAQ